ASQREHALAEEALAELQEEAERSQGELRYSQEELGRTYAQLHHLQRQYSAIAQSTSWKSTAPLRRLLAILPPSIFHQVRRVLALAWWTVTPWRTPRRLRAL